MKWPPWLLLLCLLTVWPSISWAEVRLTLPLFHQERRGYLSACLLARDAHMDIRDWVEYHHWIGVEKIFLYDHSSQPPMFNEVSDYIHQGIVQYTYFTSEFPPMRNKPFSSSLQGRVFTHCFAQGRPYFKWMMFTDVDEFAIVKDPKYNNSLPALLRKYEHAGAVLAHWKYAGSGGLKKRTPGMPLMTTFTKCLPDLNTHVKGIAFTRYATVGPNAHFFTYGAYRVGVRVGDDRLVRGGHRVDDPPRNAPLFLMHYIGSQDEWRHAVRTRSRVSGGAGGKNARWNAFIDENANASCTAGKQVFEKMPRRPFPPGSLVAKWIAGGNTTAVAASI